MQVPPALKKISILFVATGGFIGFLPLAPGTFGSVLGIGWAWAWDGAPVWLKIVTLAAATASSAWICKEASRIFRKQDASYIVIDEVVGSAIALIGIPATPYWLCWGFVLFRFFDIAKIPPADYFDKRVKNGWGVMMDDVISGIYACGILHLMMRASL